MTNKVIVDIIAIRQPAFKKSVIFTNPEIAWAGPTENELNDQNLPYEKGEFPWAASGRALAINSTEGKTKLLFDPDTKKIISQMIEENKLVDMIFTSPPYYAFRKNYSGNEDGEVGSIHVDDYADWFLEFTEKFLQILKPNGSFFLNINEKIDGVIVHPVLDELKYKMRKQGWYLVAKPYIWFKKQSMPTNCKYRAIDRYEYVYHFSNSNKSED